MTKVYLLDYVAGNVRSLVNAIEKVGYTVEWIRSPEDVVNADVSPSSNCLSAVFLWHDRTVNMELTIHFSDRN
jgi:hypothetical protein